MAVGIAEYDIKRDVDFLKKRSHFSKDGLGADITAVKDRFDPAKNEFAGGGQGQINLTVRIGYDADFHLCVPSL